MPDRSLPIAQILTMLAETPTRIAALTNGLAAAQLQAALLNPDDWSANDVLAHLRSCADVWGNAIAQIISQDKPILRAVNPRTWIKQTDYLEQDFQPSLHAFARQRTDLLALLKMLAPESWARSATITGAGKPLEWTVLSYAQRLVIHERPHLKQIAGIAKVMRG